MEKSSLRKHTAPVAPDFRAVFESLPALYLILLPDLTIVAVSDAYLNATMTKREEIIGKGLFEVFPDNPEGMVETGTLNLGASLKRVLECRTADTMPVQKYDIRKPESEGGGFVERYWSPINSPCFDSEGNIAYLVHRVEDITEFIQLNKELEAGKNGRRRAHATPVEREVFLRAQEVADTNRRLSELRRETERLLAAIVESSQDAIMSKTLEGIITSWNAGAERLLGYASQEAIGKHINFIIPYEMHGEEQEILAQLRLGKRIDNHETRRIHKDGNNVPVTLTISPIFNEEGLVMGASAIARDIRDRQEAQRAREQLRQSQKMEALGQLTGGIAHDFNNLLEVILGNLDFLSEQIAENDPLNEYIKPSIEAAEHGAELTKQLLAFGRKQSLQPKIISVNGLIKEFAPMVRRTLGERLTVVLSLEPEIWNVSVDPTQLQNALLNLAVNARDAMPEGGKLFFETENLFLDEEYAATSMDVVAGEYVMIAVSDTGTGMSQDVIEKAFEPFFTTKEMGKGTGLGLSMVYGFVKQSRGHIRLYSEAGRGACVKIYLPRVQGALSAKAVKADHVFTPVHKKNTIVLVVEDNREVLRLTSAMVKSLGYVVFEAPTGDAAMKIIAGRQDIGLLLTDVMLPGDINGPALVREALKLRPHLKVLFNSGYAEQAVLQSGLLQEGVHLIGKPFRKQQLAEKIAELLG